MSHNIKKASRSISDVPMFLLKLVDLLKSEEYQKYVSWNENGTSFIIRDQENFSKYVLPKYFKHNKIQSFIRQLNLYGFRKVTSLNQGMYNHQETEEFRHPFFLKDQANLLPLIKRKVAPTNKVSEEISQVLEEVHEIKDTQMEITNSLLEMKRENDDLWREVVSLRQKHAQQQKVVNHLIKFLVSLVQHHGMGRKRRLPLEWKNNDDEASVNKISKPISNKLSNNAKSGLSSTSAAEGPLITELLSSSTSPAVNMVQTGVEPNSGLQSADDNVFDISQLIDSFTDTDNTADASSPDKQSLLDSSALDVKGAIADNISETNNSEVLLPLFESEAANKSPLDEAMAQILQGVEDTGNFAQPVSNTNVALIEPDMFLNIPSVTTGQSISETYTSPASTTVGSADSSTKDMRSLSKINVSAKTPIFKKKKKQQNLNSNMKQIENNLQNIQRRLSQNEQYQLDYDILQDLFSGQAVLPHPSTNSLGDLPVIPFSQPDGNELVLYTGDNSLLDVQANDEKETEFDDLSTLLD